MVTDFHSSPDISCSTSDISDSTISDSTPDASGLSSTSPIPLDMLMTRKEVAQTLRITTHCLNSHKEKWKEVLPRIEMADSSIIRFRRSDVLRLIEQGYKPFSSDEQTEASHDRV